jgi:hypothetical protein
VTIHQSFWVECSDCMEPLLDEQTGEVIRSPSMRGVNMAAYSRGWFTSQIDEDTHFCPNCRLEAGI